MSHLPKPFTKRPGVQTIIFGAVLSMVAFIALPSIAHATLPVVDTSRPASIAADQVRDVKKEAKIGIEDSLLAAALGGLVETASYFTRKLAYDTATYIASGGNGQGRLLFDSPGKYFAEVGGDAVASGIGEIGKPFGLNLCQVPDARFNMFLKIGLSRIYGGGIYGTSQPTPNCRWQDLQKGGIFDSSAWNDRYGSTDKLADTFSTSLSVDNTDFGVALGAIAEVDRARVQAEEAARVEQLVNDGFKPVTDLISGQVLTPGQTIKKETDKLTATHQGEVSANQIAGIYGSGAAQIIPSAASVFLNTLTSEVLKQALTKGLFPADGGRGGAEVGNAFAADIVDNRLAAQAVFSKLFTQLPSKQLSDLNIIAEFVACPDNPGLNNCVIDSDLQRGLVQANAGNPLTIREALEQDVLHGNWPLISPRREAEHTDVQGCQVGKYCYGNLQKLRKVRILPMGFEVAALRSDPENPWTLQQVVDNFETCNRNDAGDVVPDARFPFCHLIDPNWILRSPVVRCESEVYGQSLISNQTPQRKEECVDFSTCIDEGPNGTCNGSSFAYCTKEKNIWRIGAEECPAQFNTCTTYTNTASDEITSYLSKTLDYGECSEEDVGCLAYSLERTGENWGASVALTDRDDALARKQAGRNQVIHFNRQIFADSGACTSENSEGCTEFKQAAVDAAQQFVTQEGKYVQTDTPLRLKKAPDYLGCYDTNLATVAIDWPETAQEARFAVAQNPACDAYASVCAPEEVGCEAFTLADGSGDDTEIPGVIGTENVCPATCSGYETFKQVGFVEAGAGFEEQQFPLHFIPSQAAQCTVAAVGCDEFTNIDDRARGGEQLEYYSGLRYCERPNEDGTNAKTYYSWEGSITDGFQIRTHKFLQIDDPQVTYIEDLGFDREIEQSFDMGTPAYNDDTREALLANYAACNEENYQIRLDNPFSEDAADPNCRALFDEDGEVSYRLINELVTVSESCHRIRKTETNLIVDERLGRQASCERKGGLWDDGNNQCLRCANGGTYEGGACVYQTIASESNSCAPQFAGCRAYIGNSGRNIEQVFVDNFEAANNDPDALAAVLGPWSAPGDAQVSPEAIDVGGQSLRIVRRNPRGVTAVRALEPGTLQAGASYELSFWARGPVGNMNIFFRQGGENIGQISLDSLTNERATVSVGPVWKEYRIGPTTFTGNESELVQIALMYQTPENNGEISFFLDNVSFTKLPDNLYLIKDSWKRQNGGQDVPAICDSNPNDGIPGEMLGCKPYNVVSTGETRYATGFEKLCRPKAIGCQPLWDTHNTVSGESPELARAYNVFCEAVEGLRCEVKSNQDTVLGDCIVGRAKTGCYVDQVIIPEGETLPVEYIETATVVVPADTPEDAPIFLASREEFRCRQSELGCMTIGQETQTVPEPGQASSYAHEGIMIKNDPARYGDTLCRDDLIGCGEFRAGDEIEYFKDPQKTGNSLCYYKPAGGESIAGVDETYGWFKKDVGRCIGGDNPRNLCKLSSECGEGGTCDGIGSVECYDGNYRRPGGFSDIRSNGDGANYLGLVGTCEASYNACTELIDPADTDSDGNEGKPYYVIFNEEVESRIDECEGGASLSEGCVLFDKTDEPNKRYNSEATYRASENAVPKYSRVTPVTAGDLDANIILKVDRDRACSEWLSCKNSIPHILEDGTKVDLCYDYQACNDTEPGKACTGWVYDEDRQNIPGAPESQSRLTYENYIRRGTSWYDQEYVGYSLFDKYQITDLSYLNFDPGAYDVLKENIPGVGRRVSPQYENIESVVVYKQSASEIGDELNCKEGDGNKPDWTACGIVQDGANVGRCYKGQCIYPIDGTYPDGVNGPDTVGLALQRLETNSCKGYPEEDSPFPRAIAESVSDGIKTDIDGRIEFISAPKAYQEANFCQDGDCSCSYEKLEYENNQTDYWAGRTLAEKDGGAPKGICLAGDPEKRGDICEINSDCDGENDPGICSLLQKRETHVGFNGFCLEYDLSRPILGQRGKFACLTWLPIDISASGADLLNADMSAGYNPNDFADGFGQAYCLAATETGNQPNLFDGVELTDSRGNRRPVLEMFEDQAGSEGELWEDFLERPQDAPGFNNPDIADFYGPWIESGFINRLWLNFNSWSLQNWPLDLAPRTPQYENCGMYNMANFVEAEYLDDELQWVTYLQSLNCVNSPAIGNWLELKGLYEIFMEYKEGREDTANNYFFREGEYWQPDLKSSGYGHPDDMDHRRCDHNEDSPSTRGDYRELTCDDPNPELLAGLVQQWIWRHPVFGSNAQKRDNMVVLRSEQQVNHDRLSERNWAGTAILDWNQRDVDPTRNRLNGSFNRLAETAVITKFLPMSDPGAGKSVGTVMHPPRTFAERNTLLSFGYSGRIAGGLQKIYTTLHAPGNEMSPRPVGDNGNIHRHIEKGIWKSDLEGQLRKSDLNKVHFIPTAYMNGFDMQAFPPLFTDDLFIDFDALDSAEDKKVPQAIKRATWCHKSDGGSGAGANEHFPRMDRAMDPGGCEGKNGTPVGSNGQMIMFKQVAGEDVMYGYGDMDGLVGDLADPDLWNEETDRNYIAERYALVVYNPDVGKNPWGAAAEHANLVENDPFRMECTAAAFNESWFAIGMDFNKDGEFLGYISILCSGGDRVGAPQLTVAAQLNDQCTSFAQVYDVNGGPDNAGPLKGTTNKAWTNRLWHLARTPEGQELEHPYPEYGSVANGKKIVRTTLRSAYGALPIRGEDVRYDNEDTRNVLRNASFRNAVDGLPYSCVDRYFNIPYRLSDPNRDCRGLNYADDGYDSNYIGTLAGKTENTARSALQQLFAYFNNSVRFTGDVVDQTNKGGRDLGRTDVASDRNLDQGRDALSPPQVYSLNPFRCFNNDSELPCTIGEKHNITVNGKNGTLTDYDGDGFADEISNFDEPDVIIGEGSQRVNIAFFAFADDNRMPLRKVRVHWGNAGDEDNTMSPDKRGLYKNRKPFCESPGQNGPQFQMGMCTNAAYTERGLTCTDANRRGECPEGLSCKTAEEIVAAVAGDRLPDSYARMRFGNHTDACTEGYFEFTHEYLCDGVDQLDDEVFIPVGDIANQSTRSRLIAKGLTEQDKVCVYKPRVHVEDNWGWCNGSSQNAAGEWIGDDDGRYGRAFCSTASDNAWTYYNGEVVVVPERE